MDTSRPDAPSTARSRGSRRRPARSGSRASCRTSGHEVPTSLLPSFLTVTLGAPAAALGLIEGVADGVAGVAKLAGGALADDPASAPRPSRSAATSRPPSCRARSAVATTALQVGLLRTGAWAARGIRGPSRNALLADVVHPPRRTVARTGSSARCDNLGAILARSSHWRWSRVGVRTRSVASIVPGLLAAVAIAYAARHVRVAHDPRAPADPAAGAARHAGRPSVGCSWGWAPSSSATAAATLLILRATELLTPGRGEHAPTQIALAALRRLQPGGHAREHPGRPPRRPARQLRARRWGHARVPGSPTSRSRRPGANVRGPGGSRSSLAGVGIGFVETGEALRRSPSRPSRSVGRPSGCSPRLQSAGNLAASAVAGILWTAVSPRAAFLWLAGLDGRRADRVPGDAGRAPSGA